jgi:hypothetical protein
MKKDSCIKELADNARRIRVLVENVSVKQARWKPDPDSWSILEVVNHLLDEEKLDFRVRLDITLRQSGEIWPAINPPLWVAERRYNEQNPGESLAGFLTAREDSLVWLRTLEPPDWEASYETSWGSMRAGDLMASWVGHDLLHMRQLVELHWAYIMNAVRPYSALYAGDW